jgi:hypothetical protein
MDSNSFEQIRINKNKLYTELLIETKRKENQLLNENQQMVTKKQIMEGGNIILLRDAAENSFNILNKFSKKN